MAPSTNKENEAVAGLDHQQKMAAVFAACRRVLKGGWDALAKGLTRLPPHGVACAGPDGGPGLTPCTISLNTPLAVMGWRLGGKPT